MVNFGPLVAEIISLVWGTPAHFNGLRVLAAILHGTVVVGVSQTLRRRTEGATYIRQGGHHFGHWPTFLVMTALWNRTGHYIFILWLLLSFFFMAALCNRGPLYFCPVVSFYLLSSIFYLSSFFFSSPNLDRRRLDVCHTLTHGVALMRI